MPLTFADCQAILGAFDSSTWQELSILSGTDRLRVSRRAAQSVPTLAIVEDRVSGAPPSGGVSSLAPVVAPSIGIFRRATSPLAAPLVDVGMAVGPDDAVGIIEVMDTVKPVPAGLTGTVDAVLVEDGATVEYGEVLVLIDPEQGEHGHGSD